MASMSSSENGGGAAKCPIDHSKFAKEGASGPMWEAMAAQYHAHGMNNPHGQAHEAQAHPHAHAQLSIENEQVRHQLMHEALHRPHPDLMQHHNHTVPIPPLKDEPRGHVQVHTPVLSEKDEAELQRHAPVPSIVQPLANAFQQAKQQHYPPQPSPLYVHGSHTSDDYSNAVNDAFPDSNPLPHQRIPLSTARVSSTIPRAGIDEKTGQPHDKWIYPSPQRFYNAMTRKGFSPDERQMDIVVAIHNGVNEEAWSRVKAYEDEHKDTCPNPKLARIVGRPDSLSPRAYYNSILHRGPFDRHDWYVDRCGKEVRYILDFYLTEGRLQRSDGKIIEASGTYLDIRPEMSFDRVKYYFKHLFDKKVPKDTTQNVDTGKPV